MKPICDDCQRSSFIDVAGERQCHTFCTVCGIKRACYGEDPDPPSHRVPRLTLKREWERVA